MGVHIKLLAGINKLKEKFGINRAVGYTLFSRGWQLVSGFTSIFLVARFLSPIQQGFSYTFGSVLGLQLFFELGLTFVIQQFTSHEKAHLNWTEDGILGGDPVAKARLSSLMRLTIKWYTLAAGLLVAVLVPVGLIFFGNSPDALNGGNWQTPWVWLVLTTACLLIMSPILAILEGCSLVAEVARLRFIQDLIAYPVLWLSLACNLQLFSSPLSQTIRVLISIGWVFRKQRKFLFDQHKFRLAGVNIQWWQEIWPMQWRIAISYASGFLIFQLFNPVLFKYYGAVVAGKMGMTLTLTGAVTNIALSWINPNVPALGQFIARRDYFSLDRLFGRIFSQAMVAAIFGGVMLNGFVVAINMLKIPLATRVLQPSLFLLFTITAVALVAIYAMAVYLRAHKTEPLLLNSIVCGVLTAISTYLLGRQFGVIGMALGYFTITVIISLSWVLLTFFRKRKLWHFEVKGV